MFKPPSWDVDHRFQLVIRISPGHPPYLRNMAMGRPQESAGATAAPIATRGLVIFYHWVSHHCDGVPPSEFLQNYPKNEDLGDVDRAKLGITI